MNDLSSDARIFWYAGSEGDQRIWYEPDEIESMMSEQLRQARQRLTLAAPAPDLESFVEQHLQVDLDQFAELPNGVLGVTEFRGSDQPKMFIKAALTEAAGEVPARAGARGRWRATIAHEAAHVVLHRYLFDPSMARIRSNEFRDPLERAETAGSLFRVECLHRSIDDGRVGTSRGSRDWREYQANRGMAALLMPSSIFKRVALMSGAVVDTEPEPTSLEGAALIGAIAAVFDVSRQAATYRLQAFELLAS